MTFFNHLRGAIEQIANRDRFPGRRIDKKEIHQLVVFLVAFELLERKIPLNSRRSCLDQGSDEARDYGEHSKRRQGAARLRRANLAAR